jgi:hypothetical protein
MKGAKEGDNGRGAPAHESKHNDYDDSSGVGGGGGGDDDDNETLFDDNRTASMQ